MAYNRINWQNEPSEATAINNVNLNKMDSAIYDHDQRLDDVETDIDNKVDKVTGKGLSQVDNVTVTQHVAYGTVVSTIKTYKQDGTEVTSQVCNGVIVDSALSDSSTNPVQNKAVKSALDNKVDKVSGQGLSKTNDVQVTSSTNVGTEIATVQIFPSTGGVSGVQIKNGVVVDSALSSSSENPVQNKVVKSAIDAKSTVAISDTLADGTVLANITIDGTTTAIKGSDIEVDEELSPASTNPVENRAIYDAFNNLLPEKSVSGNPIAIDDASGLNAKALTVSMNPIQDLHGYDYPWAGGAGKNKLPFDIAGITNNNQGGTWSGNSYTYRGVTFTPDSEGRWQAVGTATEATFIRVGKFKPSSGSYLINGVTGGSGTTYRIRYKVGDGSSQNIYNGDSNIITVDGDTEILFDLYVSVNYTANITFEPMLRLATVTDATFAPYSNICPISGRTEASVTRTAGEDVETHTHQYGQTVYGGEDDFVNGGLANEWVLAEYDGTENWLKASSATWDVFFVELADEATGLVADIRSDSTNISVYSFSQMVENAPCVSIRTNITPNRLHIAIPNVSTISECKAYLAEHNLQVCYKKATPTTIQTSAENISLLKGNNVISTDGDNIEMKYSVSLDSLLP